MSQLEVGSYVWPRSSLHTTTIYFFLTYLAYLLYPSVRFLTVGHSENWHSLGLLAPSFSLLEVFLDYDNFPSRVMINRKGFCLNKRSLGSFIKSRFSIGLLWNCDCSSRCTHTRHTVYETNTKWRCVPTRDAKQAFELKNWSTTKTTEPFDEQRRRWLERHPWQMKNQ